MHEESLRLKESSSSKQQSPLVRSFFLPKYSLQGSEFPIHLIWNEEKTVNIYVRIPFNFIKLKEIYNVNKSGLKIDEGFLYINDFEKNGYVGFVFESKIYEKPLVKVPIRIEIEDDAGKKQIIEQKITFFRPHVVAYEIPNEIELSQKGDEVILSEKIYIKNEGEGTALVKLEISKESDAIIKKPEEIEEFIERFCFRFSSKLKNVKRDYPQYLEIINEFEKFIIDSVKGTFVISKQYIQKMREMLDSLERAFEENESFMRDILDAILSAYLSAVNILTEIRSFLEYLKSLVENKVILLNASSMIEFKPGMNSLKGRLFIQDLAKNVYKPIEIDINVKVNLNNSVTIPLYAIFKWEV